MWYINGRFYSRWKRSVTWVNDLSILFKKDGTYEINARYRFESLISAPMSPVYDDNMDVLIFETYSSDSTGKQEVYAGGLDC